MIYIHPEHPEIRRFAGEMAKHGRELRAVCRELLDWFGANVAYSRLDGPHWPLQRSDLDVLAMKSGTCGDYANLVVSVLAALGFEAGYAWVRRDCYGDAQDHICAAVREGERAVLVDATEPYRTWFGFDCPHREFELLTPAQFEARIAAEAEFWTRRAEGAGKPRAAGLLYAPWLHCEPIRAEAEAREDVFFLLTLSPEMEPTLYAYYRRYTAHSGEMPAMAKVMAGRTVFYVSAGSRKEFWDDEQWREAGADSPELGALRMCLARYMGRIEGILREAGCA